MTKEEKIKAEISKKKMQEAIKIRIDQLCREKGMSYYALAFRASVPMSSLIHIIDGSSKNPGIYNIMKICDGLGISLADFFQDEIFEDAMTESRDEK